jgi:predicted ester cyclase
MAQGNLQQNRRVSDDFAMIARSMFDAFNQRDLGRAVANVAKDAELFSMAEGAMYAGPDGFRRYYEHWIRAFPDGTISITNIVASGDLVAVEYTGRGTQTGPLAAATGDIAPTNRPVELNLCDFMQFRTNLVVRVRSYFDAMSLWRQLGLTR